jgi:hypothetical protein
MSPAAGWNSLDSRSLDRDTGELDPHTDFLDAAYDRRGGMLLRLSQARDRTFSIGRRNQYQHNSQRKR